MPIFVDSVVVTAPQNIEELAEICENLKPSAIQIHGKKRFVASEIRERIKYTRLIKTVYVKADSLNDASLRGFKKF